MDHKCQKESNIAVLENTVNIVLPEKLDNIDETQTKIYELLDGPEGLVVETALNKDKIGRVYWFVGALTVVVMGAVVSAVAQFIGG